MWNIDPSFVSYEGKKLSEEKLWDSLLAKMIKTVFILPYLICPRNPSIPVKHSCCVETEMMIIFGGKSRPFFPTQKSSRVSPRLSAFFSFNFGYLECQLEGLTLKNVFACKFLKGLFMMPIVDFYSHFFAALESQFQTPIEMTLSF